MPWALKHKKKQLNKGKDEQQENQPTNPQRQTWHAVVWQHTNTTMTTTITCYIMHISFSVEYGLCSQAPWIAKYFWPQPPTSKSSLRLERLIHHFMFDQLSTNVTRMKYNRVQPQLFSNDFSLLGCKLVGKKWEPVNPKSAHSNGNKSYLSSAAWGINGLK